LSPPFSATVLIERQKKAVTSASPTPPYMFHCSRRKGSNKELACWFVSLKLPVVHPHNFLALRMIGDAGRR